MKVLVQAGLIPVLTAGLILKPAQDQGFFTNWRFVKAGLKAAAGTDRFDKTSSNE
jgi:hypothetical protein